MHAYLVCQFCHIFISVENWAHRSLIYIISHKRFGRLTIISSQLYFTSPCTVLYLKRNYESSRFHLETRTAYVPHEHLHHTHHFIIFSAKWPGTLMKALRVFPEYAECNLELGEQHISLRIMPSYKTWHLVCRTGWPIWIL